MTENSAEMKKAFDAPDEARSFPNGMNQVAAIGGYTFGRITLQPGWRWSESVKPMAGTDSCQVPHTGIMISGRLGIRMDDGREIEYGPGDVFAVPPGHDGWVIGDESVVNVDVTGGSAFAKQG